MIDSTASERRTGLILLQYWNRLRGDREYPAEVDIHPDEIAEIWERCFLIQVRDIEKVRDFNYTYFGSDLTKAYHSGDLDPTNKIMAAPNANHLADRCHEVLKEREPVMDDDSYVNAAGKRVLFRQVLLPIGPDEETIDAILGAVWYRLENA